MLGAPGDRLPDPTVHQRFQKNLEVPSNLVGWISNALALYTKLDLVRLWPAGSSQRCPHRYSPVVLDALRTYLTTDKTHPVRAYNQWMIEVGAMETLSRITYLCTAGFSLALEILQGSPEDYAPRRAGTSVAQQQSQRQRQDRNRVAG